MDDFEVWFRCYPRRLAKLDAMKAWRQVERHRPPLDRMLAVLKAHSESEKWAEEGGKYIPYPATYLRAGRFLDELEVTLGANKNGKPWHESASGIEAKGAELGIVPSDARFNGDWQAFRAAVVRAADEKVRAA